jgi:acylphosphatase
MRTKNIIRRHYIFEGDVQGVGFRWYASQAASAAGVTGWVRNEYDGSVTMELQGTADQIDAAVEMLGKDSWIRIDRTTMRDMEPNETERRFTVRM